MANWTKYISREALNSRGAIATLSSQRENGPRPPPSQIHSQNTRSRYLMAQDVGKRKRDCSSSRRTQGSKSQRSDMKEHRVTTFKNVSHPVPNRQASWQDRDLDQFLSTQQSVGADEWFRKLEGLTLPLFQKEGRQTPSVRKSDPKVVRIAILDTGIELRCSLRTHIKAGKSFISGEKEEDYWRDETGHGTAVAYQVARVCPNAEIYIARVAKPVKNKLTGEVEVNPDKLALVAALKEASETWKVDIINMSFGWKSQDDSDGVEKALNDVGSLGCILMFAATTNKGNLGDMLFPARHRDVIAVDAVDGFGDSFWATGSTEHSLQRERFSAPGLNVAGPGGKRWTGSSFASPIVAGIAGLVIETFRKEMPEPQASVYRRLGTREAMEAVLKLLSKTVHGFNFLQPWIELHEDSYFSRCYFCQRMIKVALRPLCEGIGGSYFLKIGKLLPQ